MAMGITLVGWVRAHSGRRGGAAVTEEAVYPATTTEEEIAGGELIDGVEGM